MPGNRSTVVAEASKYDENRAQITLTQLLPYTRQWVAFTSDGTRIVAAAPDLLELDRRVVAAGFDPEDVWFESIVIDDSDILGAEFPV